MTHIFNNSNILILKFIPIVNLWLALQVWVFPFRIRWWYLTRLSCVHCSFVYYHLFNWVMALMRILIPPQPPVSGDIQGMLLPLSLLSHYRDFYFYANFRFVCSLEVFTLHLRIHIHVWFCWMFWFHGMIVSISGSGAWYPSQPEFNFMSSFIIIYSFINM